MSKKLSILLGLRDKVEKSFGLMLADMFSKFKNKETLFIGHRDTYDKIGDFADDPTKRGFKNVASTVKEQTDWFKKYSKDYLDTVFTIEKTNSTGPSADLIVNGENWGKYTTLELLRLKSVLDGKMKDMLDEIPIRTETDIWVKSTQPEFTGREVWETPIDEGFAKTTLKRLEIVNDPHIKEAPGRAPVTQSIDTQVNIGKYTKQKYSGAITNRERAEMEVKRFQLYTGVIEALEKANNVDIVESNLGEKVLNFLL